MPTWEEEQKKNEVLSGNRDPRDMSIEDFNIMHGINKYNQYVPRGTSYEKYLGDQNSERENEEIRKNEEEKLKNEEEETNRKLSDNRNPNDMSLEEFNASGMKDDSPGPSGFSYGMYIGDQKRAREHAESKAKTEREYKERKEIEMNKAADKKVYKLDTLNPELLKQLPQNIKKDMGVRFDQARSALTTGFTNVRNKLGNRFRKQNVSAETLETSEMNVDGGKKRRTKKRSTKKRSTKKRSTNKRSTKKRSTKKRSTKRQRKH